MSNVGWRPDVTILALPVVERCRKAGLPLPVTSHMSGGRDQWSAPLEKAPEDVVRGTWQLLQEVLDEVAIRVLVVIQSLDALAGRLHPRCRIALMALVFQFVPFAL